MHRLCDGKNGSLVQLDYRGLSECFEATDKIFERFRSHSVGFESRRHIYIDNGRPVLLVAHLDTVQPPRLDKGFIRRRKPTGAGFDDRLGVFCALQLLAQYPQYFDVLLTDNEESGDSTAEFFNQSHRYNMVIGLDREGEDAVDYGCAPTKMVDDMSGYGFAFGHGSFSDICSMDHVTCGKVNIGLGTHHSHGACSGFDKRVLERQLDKLIWFVSEKHATYYDAPLCTDSYSYGSGHPYSYDEYKYDGVDNYGMSECGLCGMYFGDDYDMYELEGSQLCIDCYTHMVSANR